MTDSLSMPITFRDVPLDADGGVTIEGIRYDRSYVQTYTVDETSLVEVKRDDDARPRILRLAHGLHVGVSEVDYHARVLGLASKGALDKLHRSPRHYQAWLAGQEEEPTAAMLFGTAFHCALLEPDVFAKAYACEPDFGDCRKKENKGRRDQWREDHAGAKFLSCEDDAAIHGMVDAVRADPLAGRMFTEGTSEVTLRWVDAETGIECKARSDHYFPRLSMSVDIKTTVDARAESFARSIANFRYHGQQALYSDGFEAVGAPLEHFVFLAVEKVVPYAISLFSLDLYAVEKGRASIRHDLRKLAECIERNEWPGYGNGIQTIELPKWAA